MIIHPYLIQVSVCRVQDIDAKCNSVMFTTLHCKAIIIPGKERQQEKYVMMGFFGHIPWIKVGLGISRTNADSQWNPVYNVFHRNFCCGNETIRRLFFKRDLDAANLRPALEQGYGKQTPSARKLFSRANLLYVPNIKM